MKIRYSQLKKVVVEEMIALGLLETDAKKLGDVEDEEAKEIEPGDEANTLAKPLDHNKALKILKTNEAKLLQALGETRARLKKLAITRGR